MQKNIKKIALKIQKKAEKQLLKKPVKLIFWSIFPLISYFIASYFSAVIIKVSLALIFWNNGTGYQNAISNTITTTVFLTNACNNLFCSGENFQTKDFER